jgi:hypothetical protein
MKKLVIQLILVVATAAGVCIAQTSNQGAIVGTVKDPNGLVVPSVAITVTNIATGVARNTVTDTEGNYRFDFLQPGTYRILAEANGFRRSEVAQTTVNVSQIHREDIKLEIGSVSEEVVVTDDANRGVNTENPTLGEVINERIIDNMPLNGREFIELTGLVPGVATGNEKDGAFGSKGVTAAVGGARATYNSFYIDGADTTDNYFGQLLTSPALDAIKEFRVETSLYSAKYGRSGGGVVSVVTKSGTNRFTGSLYEFHRNQAFDAVPYFYTGSREDRPVYIQNQYGGTFGGPIFKNKTFFFFSTEFFRNKKPGQFIEGFAPTALERAGNFSQSRNPWSSTGALPTIVNPFISQNPACPDPEASGPPYCSQMVISSRILPASLITPVGQKLMDLIPEPNYENPIFNLRVFRSGIRSNDKYLLKIDHNFKDGSTLNGSYNYGTYDNTTPGLIELSDTNSFEYAKTLALGYTRNFGRSIASDTKFNYTWSDAGSQQANVDKNYAEELGFWVGSYKSESTGTPRIIVYGTGGRFITLGGQGPNFRNNDTWYIREDLIYVKGNHSVSFGVDLKAQDYGWLYDVQNLGVYFFGYNEQNTASTNQNWRVAGHPFASLLTGTVSYQGYSFGDSRPARSIRKSIGLYVQDDWKVSDRLTLNLGLRYDLEPPFASKDGKFMTLNWETGLPVYSADTPPELLENLQFNYETGGDNTPFDSNKLNFAPRIGFALRPFNDNKTVIRGGYGVVFNSENLYTTGYGSFVAPFSGLFNMGSRASQSPDRIDHLRPVTEEPYGLDAFLTGPNTPGTTFMNPREYPTGYVQHWNFGTSRDLGWGVIAEASYVGSKGTNLNGNSTLRSYDRELDARVRANNPTWTQVINLRLKGFNSSYHSMQTKLTKRFSKGLSFIGAYTWSHALAESSSDYVAGGGDNLEEFDPETGAYKHERINSNADFDIRHRLTFSGTYDLPFGNGRQFGSNWNSVVDAIFGSWRMNMIATLQSGQPFTVRGANNRTPNRICDGNLPSNQRTVKMWFDYTCFATADRNGNAPPNVIWGPGLINFDFGLHKEFKFGERFKLQLRGEAFNAFNRVNLIGPNLRFIASESGAELTRQRDNRSLQFGFRFFF